MKEPEILSALEKRGDCPSYLTLSLDLVPGELSNAQKAALANHRSKCSRCDKRWQELNQERENFYRMQPILNLETKTLNPGWLFLSKPAFIGVFSILFLFLGVFYFTTRPDQPAGIHFKGNAPMVRFLVERQGKVIRGTSPMPCRAGDRIRFAYTLEEDAYLYIINIDSTGRISAYYPDTASQSLLIRAGNDVFLPGSIRLDDYIGSERIFVFFTRTPLRFDKLSTLVRQEWQALNSRALDIEALETIAVKGHQETFLINKVAKDE
ncbi:DUF4384 domain-containing protein [candidate division CSSED10-310 bacterium]|uniref:DUF4384 domain-containing protein n=1 Tax=candidate division CSSED10-310 bacterium TaxID=2855610 RepID=A0ABV6YS43_UNCC1